VWVKKLNNKKDKIGIISDWPKEKTQQTNKKREMLTGAPGTLVKTFKR